MTRALVTGAAGFIGSHLSEELIERGYYVRGFDNFSTGNPARIDRLSNADSFQFLEGDLRSTDDVRDAVANVDYVFHQAAIPSVTRSVKDPALSMEANCVGTTNLLVAARDSDVESVVVASSSSVYGSSGELPKTETQAVDPESPYALTKYYTEKLALQFSDLYGLDAVALRYFNIFGPGQDPGGEYAAVIPKFIDLLLSDERPTIFGDGEQTRDFTFIENAVSANILAAESDCTGDALNIGCGTRTTVNELVSTLTDIIGCDIDPKYDDPRPGDVKHSFADISKAANRIDYEPSVTFREGLERTVAAMQG